MANFGSAACQAPSFSSAALAYLPTGTDLTSPVAILPSPASLARSKPCAIVTLSILESFGAISTMLLPSRLTRVGSLMVFLRDRVVHPVGVGGDEHVGRRALLDLLGEHRACGIADAELDAGLGGVGGVDLVERVLHRGCGEHGDGLVLGGGRRKARAREDDEGGEKSGNTNHGWRSVRVRARECSTRKSGVGWLACDGRKRCSTGPATAYGRQGYRWLEDSRLA